MPNHHQRNRKQVIILSNMLIHTPALNDIKVLFKYLCNLVRMVSQITLKVFYNCRCAGNGDFTQASVTICAAPIEGGRVR